MSRSADEIQLEIDAWNAALLQMATNGGIAEYSMDTGQGRQSVKRMSVSEIQARIRQLESELNEAQNGGPVFLTFDRRPCS